MATREELKRRLEAERDRLRGELGEEMRELVSGRNEWDEHHGYDTETADHGTETFQMELAVGLDNHRRALLQQVEDALRRMENGTYGHCDNCDQEIDPARLEALPWATTCLRCRRKTQAAA